MDYRLSAQDRASFKRCRRQWDFGSVQRQNLKPLEPVPTDLDRAVRDALAVYYYPGMWDWKASIVLPLVRKAFMASMATAPSSPRRTADVDAGTDLLERYFEWAPGVDEFCPLKIEIDVESIVPDSREPGRGLLDPQGRRVLYTQRIDLVATDAAEETWVVLHRAVPEWQSLESLLLDEAAIAACWAWEQTYLGMDIAGTIHNEVLCRTPDDLPPAPGRTRTGRPERGGFSQNEPSGGGRPIPQYRDPATQQPRAHPADRLVQETAGMLRRTRIRRSRTEIEAAGRQIGAELLDMFDPSLALYPAPSPAHCPLCAFVAPCLTMTEGADPILDLASRYEKGPQSPSYEPRLGAGGGGGRNISLPAPPPGA